jgi:hypothetical protein
VAEPSSCQPTKCGNSVITSEHAPRWEGQPQHLRANRELPKHERERLAIEAARIQDILDSLKRSND